MQYLELKLGDNIVSIYNSWMGEEEVKLNGQLVSKISSILGANHHFDIFENGNNVSAKRFVREVQFAECFEKDGKSRIRLAAY